MIQLSDEQAAALGRFLANDSGFVAQDEQIIKEIRKMCSKTGEHPWEASIDLLKTTGKRMMEHYRVSIAAGQAHDAERFYNLACSYGTAAQFLRDNLPSGFMGEAKAP